MAGLGAPRGLARWISVMTQFAGLDAVAGVSSALGARSVARYMVTALASLSLSPKAGILVSGFIACGFFTQR